MAASTASVPSLHDLLASWVDRDPHAVAVIDADAGGDKTLSRAQLLQRSSDLREQLRERGVTADDCVAVWLPNWSDALCWQIAATGLGAHVIGVNTRYNVDEVAHLLTCACPKVLVIADGFVGLDLRDRLHKSAAAASAPAPLVAVITGPHRPAPTDVRPYDCGNGVWAPTYGDRPTSPPDGDFRERLMTAFTTSGSTGMPKLAAHDENGVVGHAIAVADRIEIHDGDAVECMLPLSGVFGFITAMSALAGGGICLLEPVFKEPAILANMARYAVTHVVAGDDMMVRLRKAWQTSREDLSSWRWAGLADFMGKVAEIAPWAHDNFDAAVVGLYGSSEVFSLLCSRDINDPMPQRFTPGGRMMSDRITVRVVDPETDEPIPDGTDGELQFGGPTVVNAYLGNPDAALKSFTADGWFKSGDLGSVDAEGRMTYVCRIGDVLRLKGYLVDPYEIEIRLLAHPRIETAKVVGLRDADGAEHAVAYVVLAAGGTIIESEVQDWCRESLAKYKVPDRVQFIDKMPLTSGTNGDKIRTAQLREWAQDLTV